REVLDRRHVAEGLGESVIEELLEAVALDRDEIRQFQPLFEVGERIPFAGGRSRGQGSLLVDVRTASGAQGQTLKKKAREAAHGNRRSYRGMHTTSTASGNPRAGVMPGRV